MLNGTLYSVLFLVLTGPKCGGGRVNGWPEWCSAKRGAISCDDREGGMRGERDSGAQRGEDCCHYSNQFRLA